MPRILLIPEFGESGGTRTYFQTLLEFYSSQGYDVTVAVTRSQLGSETEALGDLGCRVRLIRSRPRWLRMIWFTFPFSFVFDLIVLLPMVRRLRPDLVVVSNGTPGLFLGLLLLPTRMLYIMHTYPRTRLPALLRVLLRRRLSDQRILLTVSRFASSQIIDLWLGGRQSDHVRFVYNTVPDLEPLGVTQRSRADQPPLRVLTIGHVTWYKNPVLWIEVAEAVTERLGPTEVEFVWVGEGDLREECQGMVESRGLPNVRFIGQDADTRSLLVSSHVYFQPSLVENHGLSVLEAMSMGIPCVVSSAGGLPESITDGRTGLVTDPDDVEGMAARVVRLLTDPDMARNLGSAARDDYLERFSVRDWTENMRRIHTGLLAV